MVTGTCAGCGGPFESVSRRQYCSLECYRSSDLFAEKLKASKRKAKETRPVGKAMWTRCEHCDVEFRSRTGPKNKRGLQRFCSHLCYREHKAHLFDQWIANPQTIALPQNFDEFMTQGELPCLIEGCSWRGQHLSAHVTSAHGITAREMKMLAGFNLGTGLVAPETHKRLRETNAGKGNFVPGHAYSPPRSTKKPYRSLEGHEHLVKAHAEIVGKMQPREAKCAWCEKTFAIDNPYTLNAKYCSTRCRTAFYNRPRFTLMCVWCGQPFMGSSQKKRRASRGQPVVCSGKCRGERSVAIRDGKCPS